MTGIINKLYTTFYHQLSLFLHKKETKRIASYMHKIAKICTRQMWYATKPLKFVPAINSNLKVGCGYPSGSRKPPVAIPEEI